ncbi:MAG: FkbM family methyltransferase [Crocinitomicaceae bacterium]|nr:FkbM family methyltransferase [Crocinitomicaceae bacterium]
MKQIFLFDIYEKNTIRHLLAQIEKISKRDLTIFDVGANIGFYTLTLAKALEKTKTQIYSFEPNPFTYSVFTKNIALNNFNNVLPNRLGLSDKVESLTLTFNHNNLGAANVFSGTGNKTEQIELTTLDLYCEQHKIDKIDLIKAILKGVN